MKISVSETAVNQGDDSNQLVLDHLGLVKVEVRKLCNKSSQPYYDDMLQDGYVGLLEAASRYDNSRGIKFRSFAERRIRGAIIDGLRKHSWPRSHRAMARRIEAARDLFRRTNSAEATREELAGLMGVPVTKLERFELRHQVLLAMYTPTTSEENDVAAGFITGGDTPLPVEDCILVTDALEQLPARELTVVTRYFSEGYKGSEIGKELGVNESRVSQLKQQAIGRMIRYCRGKAARAA